ncbi:MAG: hypothetical protein GY801_16085 [bacterium]|nr:hypothetical protein [bacterium]
MDINILVLAVAYKGVAVPFLWVFLDKRGHSNSYERIGLLKHVRWNKKGMDELMKHRQNG